MVDDTNKSTFNEELEKEIESGLHNTIDESTPVRDFTVKVHTQEYVVKQRFYDKDKALEMAEDLRKDESNIVEDNLEGQTFVSEESEDEDVDWNQLIDAGLKFDPPIPEAAAPRKGDEMPELVESSARSEAENDTSELEKTFIVKHRREEPYAEQSESQNESDMESVQNSASSDEDVNAIAVAAQTSRRRSRYAPPERRKASGPAHKKSGQAGLAIALLVLFAVISGSYWLLKGSDGSVEPEKTVTAEKTTVLPPSSEHVPLAVADVSDVEKAAGSTLETADDDNDNMEKTEVVADASLKLQVFVNPDGQLHPFTVHVNSCKLTEEVDRTISKLEQFDSVAFTGLVTIPEKGNWYRNFVGLFQTREEAGGVAETVRSDLGENAVVMYAPWSLQIGGVMALDKAERTIIDMHAAGFRVFLVSSSVQKDTFRVFAGAFSNENDAETMKNRMASSGFQSTPVLR